MPPVEVIATLRSPLKIRCGTCGHKATWSVQDAHRKLGGECTTRRARRRLKCSACGERDWRRVNFGG